MSLDTLLEAAKYLDHIQKTDSSDGHTFEYSTSDGTEDTEDGSPSSTYHLRLDPNLPISVQFHTYTGLQPMAAMAPQSALMSKPLNNPSNRSTKGSSETIGANAVMKGWSQSSLIRPAMHAINQIRTNLAVDHSNLGNRGDYKDTNRDHSSYSRHREMHKTLEKNRRAHLRHCFEVLKEELPPNEYNEKKSSHINIISCAIRYIQHLKRTETELHNQTERLVRTKIRFQSQIAQLMDDLKDLNSSAAFGSLIQVDGYEGQSDEQSDEEVIIELENGEDCYDDETTTTASECADDLRDSANPPKAMANTLIYVGHA